MDKTVSDIYAHVDRHIYILYINTNIHVCATVVFTFSPLLHSKVFTSKIYICIYILPYIINTYIILYFF